MTDYWPEPPVLAEKRQVIIDYLKNMLTTFTIMMEALGAELEKTADRESRLSLALDIEELILDLQAISRILKLLTRPQPKDAYTPAPEFLELYEKHGIKNSEDYKKWIESDPENKRMDEILPVYKKAQDRIRKKMMGLEENND